MRMFNVILLKGLTGIKMSNSAVSLTSVITLVYVDILSYICPHQY